MSRNNGLLNTAGNAGLGALIGSAVGGGRGAGWGAVIGAFARPVKFEGGTESMEELEGGSEYDSDGASIEGGEGCQRMFTKKYTSRNSPPYPANQCKGDSKVGNDGTLWRSVRASNGIYRWQKGTSSTKVRKSPKKSPRKSPKKSPRKSPRSNKVKYKRTFTNKKPAGSGWKYDGHGYDMIQNREEFFWIRK